MRYNKEQRLFMVKKYYDLKNYTLVRQAWHSHFKNVRAPHLTTIKSTIKRHDNTGSVASLPPLRARPEKREDAKNELQVMFQDDPSLSIRKASANSGINYGMVQSILKEDLLLKPYVT